MSKHDNERVQRVAEVDSTNLWAVREALCGAPSGTLFVAQRQSAGRGRLGRGWDSAGQGLYMSLLLREVPAHALPRMPLLAALCVCAAVDTEGVTSAIKWPNDIVADGKKLCGVLCESRLAGMQAEYCVLGAGINLTQKEEDFPEAYGDHATSLLLLTGKRVDGEGMIERFLAAIDAWLPDAIVGSEAFWEAYKTRSATLSRAVRVLEGEREFTGIARGLTQDGALVVETEHGPRTVYAADVSVRGLMGYV